MPRAATSPGTNAPAGFRVKPGFRLEVVASEPTVTAPVTMAFDENGRLFVVERGDVPGLTGTNAHSGRVRLLEDSDGEGEFHASTVYADKLPWASAIACSGGGVIVAAVPDLIFLNDSKRNGIADVRKVLFSGFGSADSVNASTLPNNFNWGLDNRIHAASAGVPGSVPMSAALDVALVPLTEADFSFDPRGLTLKAEAGPSQSGLTFDNWGRKFTCDFALPLRTPRYEPRYLARNPYFPAPPLMEEVASPATTVYRAATVHLPLPAAARLRGTNAPAAVMGRETNVTVAAWLTNAQGCVVYRGGAFGSNYQGNVFIADPSAHVIHRFVLRESGLALSAWRAMDETNSEFVASADASFCPVQLVNGPDGTLYVADRGEKGEHGRIWRIVPEDFKRTKPARLGKAKAAELVAALAHRDGWTRDTASRLLYERRDPASVPLLSNVLAFARIPLARVHALHALDGLGALNLNDLLTGLRDADGRVREHAVLLAERFAHDGTIPDVLWTQLRTMAADPSARVRYQLAFTLGEIRRLDRAPVLGALLEREPNNVWMHTAVFSSLGTGAGDLFTSLASDARVRSGALGQDWLRQLAAMIGIRGQAGEVNEVLGFVELQRAEPQQAFTLLYSLGEGLHRARSSLAQADPGGGLQLFYTTATVAIQNYSLAVPWRVGALQLLGVSPYTFVNLGDVLLLQVGSGLPEPIQSAALDTLGRYDDPRIVPSVAQRWRALTPRLRNYALAALLSRSNRALPVLAGLQSGALGAADLSPTQADYLRTLRDAAAGERARLLLGPVPVRRPEAVQRYRPALSLQGSAGRGREIYLARCAGCHQPTGETPALGSNLADARVYGREKVLMAILEPNAGVRGHYLTQVVETVDGECLVGILRAQNPTTITLQEVSGAQVVLLRSSIQRMQEQQWSLMPEGLEAGLTPQFMADLLEYVMSAAR